MKAAIYLIKSAGNVKIGYSKNPWKRYRQLCTGAASPMALVMTLYCYDARRVEAWLHNHFNERRLHGEWFRVGVSEVMSVIGDNNLSNIGGPSTGATKETVLPIDPDDSEEVTPEESVAFFNDLKAMFD